MDKDEYQRRQAAKRERFEELADKAEQRSQASYNHARGMLDMIPPGQPILVGHHSEKRHRRDLARIDSAMGKAVEDDKKASHYKDKAASVGKGGISSDDPEALEKLEGNIEATERLRDLLKALNTSWRKAKRPELASDEGKAWAASLSDQEKKVLAHALTRYAGCHWIKEPVPAWAITNMSANIRRMKQRTAALETEARRPEAEEVKGDGWTLYEDKDENRICFEFDGKPPEETRTLLKRHGFRWARSLGRWQRQLNNSGRWNAEIVAKALGDTHAS